MIAALVRFRSRLRVSGLPGLLRSASSQPGGRPTAEAQSLGRKCTASLPSAEAVALDAATQAGFEPWSRVRVAHGDGGRAGAREPYGRGRPPRASSRALVEPRLRRTCEDIFDSDDSGSGLVLSHGRLRRGRRSAGVGCIVPPQHQCGHWPMSPASTSFGHTAWHRLHRPPFLAVS